MANVLTEEGEAWVAGRMTGDETLTGQYIHWGSGAGTAAKADTGLFTPESEARVAGTVSLTGTGASAKYQNVGTITASGTKTITNAGTFRASSGGNVLLKGDFSGIAVDSGDSIQFTFTYDPA